MVSNDISLDYGAWASLILFCHLLNSIKSDENKNIVKKHPIHNFMFTFVIIHQTHHYATAEIGSQFDHCPWVTVHLWYT